MFKRIFGKKTELKAGEEIRVVLPAETWTLMEWKQDGLPCVAMLNSALKGFEPKEIFPWHLSLIIDFDKDELLEMGMPSEEERAIVDPFCDKLEEEIYSGGNALFLIRETWNATRRLVWRVHNPEIAHDHLQYLIAHHRHPRPFDYRMEQDTDWSEARWYFDQLGT